MSLRSFGVAGALALSILGSAGEADAKVKRESFYLSALAGAHVFENPEPADSVGFQLNLRGNYNFTERWGIQLSVDNGFSKETARPKNSLIVVDMTADVVLYIWNGHAITPYLAGGPGASFYKNAFLGTDIRMSFNASAGFYVDIIEHLALRFDARTVWSMGPVAQNNSPNNVNFNATVGLALRMGGVDGPKIEDGAMEDCGDCEDSDKDGIKDCDDACPTAAGTAELKGCPAAPAPAAAPAPVTPAPSEPAPEAPKSESSTTTL